METTEEPPKQADPQAYTGKTGNKVLKIVHKHFKRRIVEETICQAVPQGNELIIPAEKVAELERKLDMTSKIYQDNNGAIHIKDIEKTKALQSYTYSVGEDDARREVKVMVPLSSKATENFCKSFKPKLMELGIQAVDADERNFISDASNNEFLMVICHNHSRLESNVMNVLALCKGVEFNKIFLIIVHIDSSPDLLQASKEQLQDIQNVYSVYNIVDIACDREFNIRKCDVNEKAFQDIYKLRSRLKVVQDSGTKLSKKVTRKLFS